MARKSRLTLWQERLAAISDCPKEIFDKIEPNEETFSNVEKAEKSDVYAIRRLVKELYDAYKDEEYMNPALSYFIERGLKINDEECAKAALECFVSFDEAISLVADASEILGSREHVALIDKATVKQALIEAVRGGTYGAAYGAVMNMDTELSRYARVFIKAQAGENIGDDIARIGIRSTVHLPVFTHTEITGGYGSENELKALSRALGMIVMDEWRDFWLKAVYEYSQIYLNSDASAVIVDMISAVKQRCAYPEKKMHLLALTKYALLLGKATEQEYSSLREECRFDGHDLDPDNEEKRTAIIKDAVYTSSRDKREAAKSHAKLGTLIQHTKNRYTFKAQVSDHTKRATKHIWKLTLSIESKSGKLPIFNTMTIDDRRYAPRRCGQELEIQRKLTQIICTGQVTVEDKACPIEADLLVDISYVSTTKCGSCEIKIQKAEEHDGYLVMHCLLVIY